MCSTAVLLCVALQVSDDLWNSVHDCYHMPHIMGR
jgi:hypothetical protein